MFQFIRKFQFHVFGYQNITLILEWMSQFTAKCWGKHLLQKTQYKANFVRCIAVYLFLVVIHLFSQQIFIFVFYSTLWFFCRKNFQLLDDVEYIFVLVSALLQKSFGFSRKTNFTCRKNSSLLSISMRTNISGTLFREKKPLQRNFFVGQTFYRSMYNFRYLSRFRTKRNALTEKNYSHSGN